MLIINDFWDIKYKLFYNLGKKMRKSLYLNTAEEADQGSQQYERPFRHKCCGHSKIRSVSALLH